MEHDVLTLLIRLGKFGGVMSYAAATGVGLWVSEPHARRQVVHRYASPALLIVWAMGYLLTQVRGVTLYEAWVVGGFLSSLTCHVFLLRTTRAGAVSSAQRWFVVVGLTLTLGFMTFRPTLWRG